MLLGLATRFVFHPASAAEDWMAPPPRLNVRDVELASKDGTRLHAWWAAPTGWQPAHGALLYCHGNAGNLSHRGEELKNWCDLLGVAVLIFDYPGYGKSSGRPSEAGCYAGAEAAYDWLTEAANVPADRILLYGRSLGGAVAIDLAGRRPHRALVLMNAFSSLADMARKVAPWLPARWLVRNRLDNLVKIRACRRPVFIAHGTADCLVPFAQGERLFAAANEPKQFFAMPDCGHNHFAGEEFYEALRRFLARVESATKVHDPAGA